jgi:hypothetical protein
LLAIGVGDDWKEGEEVMEYWLSQSLPKRIGQIIWLLAFIVFIGFLAHGFYVGKFPLHDPYETTCTQPSTTSY